MLPNIIGHRENKGLGWFPNIIGQRADGSLGAASIFDKETDADINRAIQSGGFATEAGMIAADEEKGAEITNRLRRALGVTFTGEDPDAAFARAKEKVASLVPWLVIGGLGTLAIIVYAVKK